jgi:CHAT domain
VLTEPKIKAVWASRASHRDIILKNLEDQALDLIYFYCHACDQDEAGDTVEPYLAFQDAKESEPGMIDAADLAVDDAHRWKNHPLVLLNGCRTAGFSPRALSPFIVKLTEDRGAAGVIGTEISVWEPLASEMALTFLREFLTGKSAGEALLIARRALLAKYNPLGLVYTLYATANLSLDLDGDGKCC